MRAASLHATAGLLLLLCAGLASAGFTGSSQLLHGHNAAHRKHTSLLNHHLGNAHRGFKQQKAAMARTFGAQQATNVTTNETTTTAAPTSTSAVLFCATQMENMTARLRAKCGNTDDIATLIDPANNTQQATNAINTFCSSTCQDEVNALRREMAACLTEDSKILFDVIQISCQRIDGILCAQKIRGFDRLECDGLNEVSCRSSNKSCGWRADINGQFSCESVPSQAVLQEVCSPCLDKFMLLFGRLSGDDLQRTLLATKELMCVKSGQTFCLPVFNAVDYRVYELEPRNNLTLDAVNGNISAACNDADHKRCMTKVGLATAKIIRIQNDFDFRICLVRSSVSQCVNNWITTERAAVQVERSLPFTCATNDEGLRCLAEFHAYLRNPCQQQFETGMCNETCGQVVSNFTGRARCCLDKYQRIQTQVVNTARLPANNGGTPPAQPNITWETSPMRPIANLCANASGFNESLVRERSTVGCTGATTIPRKELPLRGLLWSSISNNSAFQAKLIYSLQVDIAQSIGCPVEQIVNMTLSEDTSQALNASVRARQQSTGASSGTKASFGVSGDSNTDATANSNAYDSGRSTMTLPLAAGVIQEECATCVAAPTAAPGQTPAPFSLSDLFASLTGADQAITSSTTAAPGGGSGNDSASAVTVAWVAIALSAVVMLFVAA